MANRYKVYQGCRDYHDGKTYYYWQWIAHFDSVYDAVDWVLKNCSWRTDDDYTPIDVIDTVTDTSVYPI